MQPGQSPPGHFNLDRFLILIDSHASRCMANAPHLFQDQRFASNRGQVDGIGKGLHMKVKEIQVSVKDNNRRVHTIKIPNSLYLPMLRQCLLLPQHWMQEEGTGKHGW
jgi:hypothetical protein